MRLRNAWRYEVTKLRAEDDQRTDRVGSSGQRARWGATSIRRYVRPTPKGKRSQRAADARGKKVHFQASSPLASRFRSDARRLCARTRERRCLGVGIPEISLRIAELQRVRLGLYSQLMQLGLARWQIARHLTAEGLTELRWLVAMGEDLPLRAHVRRGVTEYLPARDVLALAGALAAAEAEYRDLRQRKREARRARKMGR
jgi:hypothetical protein